MYPEISLITAYFAGVTSFFAPCLLPLLPSYFSIITGFTFKDLYGLNFEKIRSRVFFSAVFFVAGFAVLFTLLGAAGYAIGTVIYTYEPVILRISGGILVFLGLLQIGVIHFEGLQYDYAWNVQRRLTRLGYVSAFLSGITIAIVWIPCTGSTLGAILLLAAQTTSVSQGSLLLFIYALGLGTPFLVLGLFFPAVFRVLKERRGLLHSLSLVAGFVMIIFGIVLVLGQYKFILEQLTVWEFSLLQLFSGK